MAKTSMTKPKKKVVKVKVLVYLGIDNFGKIRFGIGTEYEAEKERLKYKYELKTTRTILKRDVYFQTPIYDADYKVKINL